jgi:transcriptional regulator with XRE-family HTH domain
MQIFFSFSPADDLLPIGSSARFGFVSMVRLNLALSLAKRGVIVSGSQKPARPPAQSPPIAPKPIEEDDDEGAPSVATFGSLLRRHRLAAGLSQEALAERARMSTNGLAALERGTRRNPQRETLGLLTRALALDAEERATFEAAAKREPRSDAARPSADDVALDLQSADVLIVVLTPAWIGDPICRDHLVRFLGEERPSDSPKRIIVVRRAAFSPSERIEKLSNVRTCDFFRATPDARSNELLYRNDGTPDPAFYDVVDELAEKICSGEEAAESATAVEGGEPQRAVYVAPPAEDMIETYRTLVTELEAEGYAVVPDLANALVSIHLLGEQDDIDESGRSRLGFALDAAADRASSSDGALRRIIYAPKTFASATTDAGTRDPIAVRDRFTRSVAGDCVIGGSVTGFVLSAKDLIRASARLREPAQTAKLKTGSVVFLNFHPGDVQYARAISKALRERGLRARFAAFEDDKIQNKITNGALAKESDAVIHCWATATDAWLYGEAAEYEDWRKFGRTQPFAARAAIAGPPEGGSKMLYTAEDPPEAIDVYLDLTARALPQASDLDPIVMTLESPRPS